MVRHVAQAHNLFELDHAKMQPTYILNLGTSFLNDIKCSRIPNHKLTLKVGELLMLLRNIDQAHGLCNDTRLFVNELSENHIVITRTHVGDKIYS